ncbi:hypothetical protein [Serratia marcescens]|uniref:hypothetical protein n=1 Tax=Serratia marcescens TaxID=615 RepID=UPI003F49EA7E
MAWRHDDGPFAGMALTRSKSVADSWIANGWTVTPLFPTPPAPAVSDGLKRAVTFYEQVKREKTPVETGAWKDAVNWVLEEACRSTMLALEQGNGGHDGKISD